MKYLAWILGLFAAAVGLAIVSHNPGYVLLVYPPYRVELSLTLFVVLTLFAFAVAYLLLRLTLLALQLPSHVRKFRLGRAQARSRALLEEMLGAFFEGRYAAAEKAAVCAMESGETSALYPVVAARSAHELREFRKRDAYLDAADGKTVGDTTMKLVTAGKFLLDQRDPQAALKVLQELRDSGVKRHPGVLSLELRAQQQAGNWDEVLNLLDRMEKREAIDAVLSAQLRQHAWLEKIRQQEDADGVSACLKNIPGDLRRTGKIAAAAAGALIRHGGYAAARQLLSDSLNAQWDSELVMLYGDCHPPENQASGDAVAQIEQAEKWLKLHQQDAGLLLALGKLCLHQKLWGKAQSYLDASLSIEPGREAYATLARLAERLGRADEAARYYQSAMRIG